MSAGMQPVGPMSTEAFLAWEPGDGRRWQLVDGEPRAMAPANRTHGALQSAVAFVLYGHLRTHAPQCSVVTEPGVIPSMFAAGNVRVPDLAVTCTSYTQEEQVLREPVLIVEILSPGNAASTWANVWAYATLPSLREILILHTAAIGATLLRRSADGTWPQEASSQVDSIVTLESVGLRLDLAALYATTRLAVR